MRIETSEQLERVLNAVTNDLVHANCYYKLYLDINDSVTEYNREVNQSRAFWGLTCEALLESTVIRLCRVYERNSDKKATSLQNLLAAIKLNLQIFDFEPFCDRVRSNVHLNPVDAWASLDEIQLEADIAFASESNESVRRLVRWRDNMFVHRSSTLIIKKIELHKSNRPTYGDYDCLLDNGMTIINRYSSLFNRHTHGRVLLGHDDFKHVLRSIRESDELHRERLKAKYKKYGIDDDGE